MVPHPVTPSQHPGSSETPWKLHLPSKGAGDGGSAAGTDVPGKRPEGRVKGVLDTELKKESKREAGDPLSGAEVADDRDGRHSLDRGSLQRRYHFQLELPSPSWPLRRHNLRHKRHFFCVVPAMEQVLDLAHGKEARGRDPSMGNTCCCVP